MTIPISTRHRADLGGRTPDTRAIGADYAQRTRVAVRIARDDALQNPSRIASTTISPHEHTKKDILARRLRVIMSRSSCARCLWLC